MDAWPGDRRHTADTASTGSWAGPGGAVESSAVARAGWASLGVVDAGDASAADWLVREWKHLRARRSAAALHIHPEDAAVNEDVDRGLAAAGIARTPSLKR